MSTVDPNASAPDPKRLVLFVIVASIIFFGTNLVLERLGLLPKPAEPRAEELVEDDEAEAKAKEEVGADEVEAEDVLAERGEDQEPLEEFPAKPPTPMVAEIDPDLLVLPSLESDESDERLGYHLRIQTSQRGAGVFLAQSLIYNAEYEGRKPRKRPLTLVEAAIDKPPPLSMEMLQDAEDGGLEPVGDLEDRLWKVLIPDVPLDDLTDQAREK